MGQLFESIRTLVLEDRYVIGEHAVERLEERGILDWQVVDGIERGILMAENPGDRPNPTVEVRQMLANGTEIKAVWSYLVKVNIAKLVTVHYFDE